MGDLWTLEHYQTLEQINISQKPCQESNTSRQVSGGLGMQPQSMKCAANFDNKLYIAHHN
jgi:hypothetical protein